jgi:hypothetical protein
MTVLHGTADVARPVDEAFAYVSDKLFLDREERSTHLMKKTRETADERRKLLSGCLKERFGPKVRSSSCRDFGAGP